MYALDGVGEAVGSGMFDIAAGLDYCVGCLGDGIVWWAVAYCGA